MELSAPIYALKRRAKILSRSESIPLHAALDRIAGQEGFATWSLLASTLCSRGPAGDLLRFLKPGDVALLGARPGHGKTLLGLELAARSVKAGSAAWFFTLEWTMADVLRGLQAVGESASTLTEAFNFDDSDQICASYIVSRLAGANSGTIAVIDYLQLLDQKRGNPELAVQVRELRAFARDTGVILVLISQIDRWFDGAATTEKSLPGLNNVRLPNPLDLTLFDKACFMHNGSVQLSNCR